MEKNILSVKINKVKAGENLFVIVGHVDGMICGYDLQCNPIFMIEHNSSISSIDFINNDTFITGSWDGKAIVWSLKTKSTYYDSYLLSNSIVRCLTFLCLFHN